MHVSQCLSRVSDETLAAAVTRYDALVAEDLKPLDTQRYQTIPAVLAERKAAAQKDPNSELYLTRDELITLMQWKLKHGTFRPRLLDLIKANDEEAVQKHSLKAFKALTPITDREIEEVNDDPATAVVSRNLPFRASDLQQKRLKEAIQNLKKLSGVGPATASLILSCYDPHNIPFHSDELVRWSSANEIPLEDTETQEITPHPCWNMKLKYSINEYFAVYERIITSHTGVLDYCAKEDWQATKASCTDLEKAAWVFCREDGLPEDKQESGVEQEFVFTRKSAIEQAGGDTNSRGQFKGRPKRKSADNSAPETRSSQRKRGKS